MTEKIITLDEAPESLSCNPYPQDFVPADNQTFLTGLKPLSSPPLVDPLISLHT